MDGSKDQWIWIDFDGSNLVSFQASQRARQALTRWAVLSSMQPAVQEDAQLSEEEITESKDGTEVQSSNFTVLQEFRERYGEGETKGSATADGDQAEASSISSETTEESGQATSTQ